MGKYKLKRKFAEMPGIIAAPFGTTINLSGTEFVETVPATKKKPESKRKIRGATDQEITKAVTLNRGYARMFDYVTVEDGVETRVDAWQHVQSLKSKTSNESVKTTQKSNHK